MHDTKEQPPTEAEHDSNAAPSGDNNPDRKPGGSMLGDMAMPFVLNSNLPRTSSGKES
jgi:hypothetical protein